MKLVLCAAIVALCMYIGRLLAKRMTQRLAFLRDYQSAMVSLSDAVAGMHMPLDRALKVAENETMPDHFNRCAALLGRSPQTKFSQIWRESLEVQDTGFLTKDDMRLVLEGGGAVEALCTNPTEKQAGIYLKRLTESVDAMEIEKRKKCKLYHTTGVLAGLLIALMVI